MSTSLSIRNPEHATLFFPNKSEDGTSFSFETFQLDINMHKVHRASVVARFQAEHESKADEEAVFLFQGSPEVPRNDTDHEPMFRQESTFMYLFGVNEPDMYGLIHAVTGESTLFIPRLDPSYAIWMGTIKTPEDYKNQFGVDHCLFVDEIESVFSQSQTVYFCSGRNTDSGSALRHPQLPFDLAEKVSSVVTDRTLYDVVVESRVHKTEEEARLIAYVNKISSQAHLEMLKHCQPGLSEAHIEAVFNFYSYFAGGSRRNGYTPIVGSGANSAVLHYGHSGAPNDKRMEDGDMVLCDLGCEVHGYTADITNTFPVNGRFSEDQAFVFTLVADMQRAVFEQIRPGALYADFQQLCYDMIADRFVQQGILKRPSDGQTAEEHRARLMELQIPHIFMPHGLGHLLGVDTHDVGGYKGGVDDRDRSKIGFKSLRLGRPLETGMVLTVEPGVYFIDFMLDEALADEAKGAFFDVEVLNRFRGTGGVRLEDNLLITETGFLDFTFAPRTVEEVEAVMRGEIKDIEQLRKAFN
jgi:Xaa-Pro dipeptidase